MNISAKDSNNIHDIILDENWTIASIKNQIKDLCIDSYDLWYDGELLEDGEALSNDSELEIRINMSAAHENKLKKAGFHGAENITLFRAWFDREDLRESIEWKLNKEEKHFLQFCGVSDLSPLGRLVEMENLYLNDNQIIDLNPLQDLSKLKTLELGDNKIVELSPLKKLFDLEILGLSNNQISDLSPLRELTELKELFLKGNEIVDLSPLEKLSKLKLIVFETDQFSSDQINTIKKSHPDCLVHIV